MIACTVGAWFVVRYEGRRSDRVQSRHQSFCVNLGWIDFYKKPRTESAIMLLLLRLCTSWPSWGQTAFNHCCSRPGSSDRHRYTSEHRQVFHHFRIPVKIVNSTNPPPDQTAASIHFPEAYQGRYRFYPWFSFRWWPGLLQPPESGPKISFHLPFW